MSSKPRSRRSSKSAPGVRIRTPRVRLALEPLEDRRLLTVDATTVDDNWFDLDASEFGVRGDGVLQAGDLVINFGDVENWGNITKVYGVDGFGRVANTNVPSLPGMATIHDAIQNTTPFPDGSATLTLLEGTYAESDIVVDRPLTIFGAGQSGDLRTVIVPEVASARGEANFPVNSRQGIIIAAPNVSIENLTLDGSGNPAAGAMAYHQGITTIYDTQAGGGYSSLRNGLLSPQTLANDLGTASILLDHVTVKNTYWHGITLSATSGNTMQMASVNSSIVSGVNTGGSQNLNRVGILLQNVDRGVVTGNSVSGAGVGIQTTTFGTNSFGSNTAARNRALLANNSVSDTLVRGYSLTNADSQVDENEASSLFTYFVKNTATFSNPLNQATGLYLDHSQPTVIDTTITGAKIGVAVANTTLSGNIYPLLTATTITGPGIGVAGSTGVLVSGGSGPSASLALSAAVVVSGFATGVRAEQIGVATDGQTSTALLDRATITGNGVAVSLGDGSRLAGSATISGSIVTSGSATIAPGFPLGLTTVNGTDPIVPRPPDVDAISAASWSLSSTATFAPLLSGQAASIPLFNFNAPQNYAETSSPQLPVNGQTTQPFLTSWNTESVSQNGSGQLVIDQGADNGFISMVLGTSSHFDPDQVNNPGVYDIDPLDIRGQTTLNIIAKAGADNQSQIFMAGLVDSQGRVLVWPFSFSALNSTAYTTVTVNLSAPSIRLLSTPDNQGPLDLAHIAGYVITGDLGLAESPIEVPFSLSIDDLSASSPAPAARVQANSVNLAGATLGASLAAGFLPGAGQSFTIVNNTGAGAIAGTFAGLSEGANLSIGGSAFSISYTGGTGNDVVLTRSGVNAPPVVDLNGAAAGNNFATTWAKAGAVNLASSSATTADDAATLTSLTATIVGVNSGDVLSAVAPSGSGITIDAFNSGTLFMHGVSSLGNYTTLLKSIKYNNLLGSPLVASVTINLVANDGGQNSNVAVATVSIANSSIANGGRRLFYNNSGAAAPARYDGANAAINVNDDSAIATDKTAYLPGSGTASFANVSSYSKGINGLMIDITGPHAATLSASDFIFKTGGVGSLANINTPSTSWVTFTATPTISIRAGAGVGGSDRVEIVWPDNVAPKKTWLEIIVKANANTGLAQKAGYPAGQGDVFFFGNAVADSGEGDTTNAVTNSTDELAARAHPAALATNVPITNRYDFNRDAKVDSTDQLMARNNGNANATSPRFINIANPPGAPETPNELYDAGGNVVGSAVANVDAVSAPSASPSFAADEGLASGLTSVAAESPVQIAAGKPSLGGPVAAPPAVVNSAVLPPVTAWLTDGNSGPRYRPAASASTSNPFQSGQNDEAPEFDLAVWNLDRTIQILARQQFRRSQNG